LPAEGPTKRIDRKGDSNKGKGTGSWDVKPQVGEEAKPKEKKKEKGGPGSLGKERATNKLAARRVCTNSNFHCQTKGGKKRREGRTKRWKENQNNGKKKKGADSLQPTKPRGYMDPSWGKKGLGGRRQNKDTKLPRDTSEKKIAEN